jgi:hypothetical protein
MVKDTASVNPRHTTGSAQTQLIPRHLIPLLPFLCIQNLIGGIRHNGNMHSPVKLPDGPAMNLKNAGMGATDLCRDSAQSSEKFEMGGHVDVLPVFFALAHRRFLIEQKLSKRK